MAVNTIDHVNIRSAHMAETIAFYADMLEMTVSAPPSQSDMAFGAWIISDDGRSIIHVNPWRDEDDFLGESDRIGATLKGSGRIHHIALDCSGYDSVKARLEAGGHRLRFNSVPELGLRQIFVNDPNDILVELNFR